MYDSKESSLLWETLIVKNDESLTKNILRNRDIKLELFTPEKIRDKDGNTPLFFALALEAFQGNSLEIFDLLLKDEDLRKIWLEPENLKDKYGTSLLSKAISLNLNERVKNLLDDKDLREIFFSPENVRDQYGHTPLFKAISLNQNEIIATLLGHQDLRKILFAPENLKDKAGKTPLFMAQNKSILTSILQYEEVRRILFKPENLKMNNGLTFLDTAIYSYPTYQDKKNSRELLLLALQYPDFKAHFLSPDNKGSIITLLTRRDFALEKTIFKKGLKIEETIKLYNTLDPQMKSILFNILKKVWENNPDTFALFKDRMG